MACNVPLYASSKYQRSESETVVVIVRCRPARCSADAQHLVDALMDYCNSTNCAITRRKFARPTRKQQEHLTFTIAVVG